MSEELNAAPGEAVGPNPHYKPPLMRWNQVEILAAEGTELGIVIDEGGVLRIAVRPDGQGWPHDSDPPVDTRNTIAAGKRFYVVFTDDRGPAVGHEFVPDPANPGICAACGK